MLLSLLQWTQQECAAAPKARVAPFLQPVSRAGWCEARATLPAPSGRAVGGTSALHRCTPPRCSGPQDDRPCGHRAAALSRSRGAWAASVVMPQSLFVRPAAAFGAAGAGAVLVLAPAGSAGSGAGVAAGVGVSVDV